MKISGRITLAFFALFFINACGGMGNVASVTSVSNGNIEGLGESDLAKLAEIKKASKKSGSGNDAGLKNVIESTPNYTVSEYHSLYYNADTLTAQDYTVGGYDVLSIIVYEETDLSQEKVRISSDGYISFPLIGRLQVDNLTTSEIEYLISTKLAEGQFLLDAHISVSVVGYNSKKFMILGEAVKEPGTYSLQARERVLDAISKAGGIDFEQGGKRCMIIRVKDPYAENEKKIVIHIDLPNLLKGTNQLSNLLLVDKDRIYIPRAEHFYIIGQVQKPGSYPHLEKDISIVEAISTAGGFTRIAARNKTRIVRVENGMERIIKVRIDEITKAGKKGQDINIQPGDIIIVPETFF